MKKLLFLFLLLMPLALPSRAHAQTWPGQCPVGTAPNAIGCVPEAVAPVTTDLTYCWQVDQEPKTRACQFGQILAAGLAGIFSTINAVSLTLTGSLTVPTAVIQILSGSTVYAAYYGVIADATVSSVPGSTPSGTSNDQALGLALYACNQNGYRLVLPAGGILLTGASLTGNATRLLQNCFMQGSGVPAAAPGVLTGTTFLITSTSVTPFIGGNGFGMEDFNVYWPGQTGAVVYPPFLTDGGTGTIMGNGNIHNVNWMNAWDGVVQSTCSTVTACAGTGNMKFTDMTVFAAHDNFRVTTQGDGWIMSNVRVVPAAWLNFCNHSTACNTAVGGAASIARALHGANATDGTGGAINISITNMTVVGAQYGILLDSAEVMGESTFTGMVWDNVATIVDTSSGAEWAGFVIQFNGVNAACQKVGPVWGGPPSTATQPCFNIGSNDSGDFVLDGFKSAGSAGDFLDTAGASVVMLNSESLGIAGQGSGTTDYYQINVTAGSQNVRIENNRFSGRLSNAHVHGITTTGATPNFVTIAGNQFLYMNDEVNMTLPIGAIVTANSSVYTNGAGGLVSFNQVNASSPGGIVYNSNAWDDPPLPTCTTTGSGCSIHAGSTVNSGVIQLAAGTVTGFNFIEPLTIYGECTFWGAGAFQLFGGPSGLPATWGLGTFLYNGAPPFNAAGANVFYSCPGS